MKDLKALRGMTDTQIFEDEVFGFHVQQTAEKSLKAWIAYIGIEYPHTHDISLLLQSLRIAAVDVEPYWDLVEYNVFAVQFRYQSMTSADEPIDRTAAIGKVEALFQRVHDLMEG